MSKLKDYQFTTSYQDTFTPIKNHQRQQTATVDVRASKIAMLNSRQAPTGELMTSYSKNFPEHKCYGRIPKPKQTYEPSKVPMEKATSYSVQCQGNTVTEEFAKEGRDEKLRLRQYKRDQVTGSLSKNQPKFITGSTVSKDVFVKPQFTKLERMLPYDMLMVPHDFKMQLKTQSASQFSHKEPMRRHCK